MTQSVISPARCGLFDYSVIASYCCFCFSCASTIISLNNSDVQWCHQTIRIAVRILASGSHSLALCFCACLPFLLSVSDVSAVVLAYRMFVGGLPPSMFVTLPPCSQYTTHYARSLILLPLCGAPLLSVSPHNVSPSFPCTLFLDILIF